MSSLQDHYHHHQNYHYQQQQQQRRDAVDVSDTADVNDSVDDATSELSDEEAASVIEVELGPTDHWSAVDTDHHQLPHQSSLPSNSIPTGDHSDHWSAVSSGHTGPPTSSSLPSNHTPANDDSVLRARSEYIQTAPWRCLPIRHRASIASYSDPDISSSVASVSDFERQRLTRARQRRHLARSTELSQTQLAINKSSSSSSQPASVTTENNDSKQRQQAGHSSYVPQKPPPPLPMPDNDLAKQLRPVQTNETTTTKPSSSSSSLSSLSGREKQIPVRELVAQLSGQMPPIPATTTTTTTTTTAQLAEQQQQQKRRQLRRQQLHSRALPSSSSSDAEADYEIFINTPPAAAARRDHNNHNENNSSSVCSLTIVTHTTSPSPLPSARQHPSYGDCLEVKREYYQNSSVLDCVTQCSQSAAHLYEQFL